MNYNNVKIYKSITKTLNYLKSKYGYNNNCLNIGDINYIFKTNNINGIESRYIEIQHKKHYKNILGK